MNKVILIGRLCDNPDIKVLGEKQTKIARYRLAVDRKYKAQNGERNADFISCVAFGKNGEFAEKYLRKGMKIAVEGHIQTGSYKKDDNSTVYTTDVVVESHEFCESKKSSDDYPEVSEGVGSYNDYAPASPFSELPDDEGDLPF